MMAPIPRQERRLIIQRLRHLLLTEGYGRSDWTRSDTEEPIAFAARSMRRLFGYSREIDEPELTGLPIWSKIPESPVDAPPLGPAFDEPIDDTDASQIIRRLVYLREEEDLRTDLLAARATLAFRRLPELAILEALRVHTAPNEREVLRWPLRFGGFVPEESLGAPFEELLPTIRRSVAAYPQGLAAASPDTIRRLKAAGLVPQDFAPSRTEP